MKLKLNLKKKYHSNQMMMANYKLFNLIFQKILRKNNKVKNLNTHCNKFFQNAKTVLIVSFINYHNKYKIDYQDDYLSILNYNN